MFIDYIYIQKHNFKDTFRYIKKKKKTLIQWELIFSYIFYIYSSDRRN